MMIIHDSMEISSPKQKGLHYAKRPSITKSPIVLAKQALLVAQKQLPAYSVLRSRHDFTRAQLVAILTLRQFFNTDYRGIIKVLEDSSGTISRV